MSVITNRTAKLAKSIKWEYKKLHDEANEKMRYKLYDMFKDIFEDDVSLMEISWKHSTDMDHFVNIDCEDEELEEILQNIPHHLFTELFAHRCTVSIHRHGDIKVEDHNTNETKYYEMLGHSEQTT